MSASGKPQCSIQLSQGRRLWAASGGANVSIREMLRCPGGPDRAQINRCCLAHQCQRCAKADLAKSGVQHTDIMQLADDDLCRARFGKADFRMSMQVLEYRGQIFGTVCNGGKNTQVKISFICASVAE